MLGSASHIQRCDKKTTSHAMENYHMVTESSPSGENSTSLPLKFIWQNYSFLHIQPFRSNNYHPFEVLFVVSWCLKLNNHSLLALLWLSTDSSSDCCLFPSAIDIEQVVCKL